MMSITSWEGLRAASICPDLFVARQVEETEPRSAAGQQPGRRSSVDTGRGSRAAETHAAGRNRLRRAQVHLGLSRRTQRLRARAKRQRANIPHEEHDKAGPTSSVRVGAARGSLELFGCCEVSSDSCFLATIFAAHKKQRFRSTKRTIRARSGDRPCL